MAGAVVVALVVRVGGVEAVGVAEFQAPHRCEEGLAGDVGVAVEHVLERAAGEVPGVEALLVVAERGRGAEVVRAGRPGVAHHAVAVGGHVERRRAGVGALGPLVGDRDGDGPVAQGPLAEVQTGAVELLVGGAAEVLGGAAGAPAGRLRLGPHQGGVVGPVEREGQRLLVDPQADGGRADPPVRPGVGEGGADRAEGGGGREVGAGRVVGEGAVRGEPDPEHVGAGDDDPGGGGTGRPDGEGVTGAGDGGGVPGGRGPGRKGRAECGQQGSEQGQDQGGGRPAVADGPWSAGGWGGGSAHAVLLGRE